MVGYKRIVKAEGLSADPPVIDCSGWVGLLLAEAMQAENVAAERIVFAPQYIMAMRTWSDRMITEIKMHTGFILEGSELLTHDLPRYATFASG